MVSHDNSSAHPSWTTALFEAIDDAVFVHDLEGRILEANEAACRRLGYARAELLQLRTRDIDADEFAGGYAERLRQQLAQGRLQCEGRHRTKDGRIIPVDINTSTIQLDGQLAVLAVMRDISQRKQAEENLLRDLTTRKQAERRLAAQYAVARVLAEGAPLEASIPDILRHLCEGLDYDVGVCWTMLEQGRALSCLDVWSVPGVQAAEFVALTRRTSLNPDVGLPGKVWVSEAPRTLDAAEPAADERMSIAAREGLTFAAGFPIHMGPLTIGVLEFLRRKPLPLDDDILSMMQSMGSQLGQAFDRQRVERALRDSEAVYHSLVESLPQNIFRKDLTGRLTFTNARYCATLKRSRIGLLGKTDFDLFPAELAAKYVNDDRRVVETGETLETIEEHYLPDGSRLHVHVVKTPTYDAEGRIVGTQGIFWDVTERQRAAEMLARSERRYRQLTEATLDGIVLADAHQRILLFNPSAERLFGYQASEVLGKPIELLIPEEYRTLHHRGFSRFMETRQPRAVGRTLEMHGRRKDGSEFPVELALTVVSAAGGEGPQAPQFLAAFRDLTERNRMRTVLVQNEKLASIGLLSAGVAHEINNPLSFVANNLAVLQRDFQGYQQLLKLYESVGDQVAGAAPGVKKQIDALAEDIDLPYLRENLPRLIERTRDGVERVTRIVHSLRGLARTDAPRRQDVHVTDLIDATLEILHGRFKRSGIIVEQDNDPDSRISCVSIQLQQVLLNLLMNAFQAVEAHRPSGGKVTIRTRRLDEEFLIEISDNGGGIQPENLPRLFDPFFTTKDVGEGTGLGLSITHNIVAGHGGRIQVDSRPGEGACFQVYLPLGEK